MAGMAFSFSGLGLVHALASSLGGMIDAPHGVCLAACTRVGLSYNMEVCRKDLEVLAGITSGKKRGHSGASAESFLDDLETLITDLGLPVRPSELGIKKEDAETILQKTLIQVRRIITNPRPLDDQLLECIRKGI
jgi:alcohol dehydrogenase class IV